MATLKLSLQVRLQYTVFAICFVFSTFLNAAEGKCTIISSQDSCRIDVECNSNNYIEYDSQQLRRDYIICPPLQNPYQFSNTARLYVKYKNIQTTDIIPNIRSPYGYNDGGTLKHFIVELDLENQTLSSAPTIKSLPNLKTLKLNGNRLIEAKLFNSNELPSLRELDLSHNMINSFNVQRGSYQLTLLNVSNNYLKNIPESTFYFLDSLRKLDLSHNNIDILGVLTFEGIKHLIFLDLSSNRITELNNSLMRFSELEELYLDNNRISKLLSEDFNRMVNIKILSMRSNFITNIDESVFSKILHLSKLDLRHNLIAVLHNDNFAGLIELENIDLSYNKIKTLPPYLFKGKNVQFFGIVGNALASNLLGGTFEGLKLMTELDLSHQHLTEVDDNGFFGLDALTSLLLNNNDLITLSNLSFASLHNLERLELSNNKLIRIHFYKKDMINLQHLSLKNNSVSYLGKTDFSELTALEFLDLSMNNISHIHSDSFENLNRLTDLDLSNNPLSGILEGLTFNGLSSIPKLDISHTLLTLIKDEAFKGMEELKELNVSYGKINEIEFNSFAGATLLEILDLTFNNINVFMINNTELVNLTTLYLNNNKITSVPNFMFGGLFSLNKLVMANNSIQNMDNDAFGDNSDLRYLDISFNTNLAFNMSVLRNHNNLHDFRLSGIKKYLQFTNFTSVGSLSNLVVSYCSQTNITALDLRNLTKLHILDLSNNNVLIVEGSAFYGLENLDELNLSFNNITFINPGVFKDNIRLQKLNISHNSIKFISYGIFRGLGDLSLIDISYNQIKSLKSERFYEIEKLNYLIADHNQIDYIALDEFSNTSLKYLSIGGNPLACDILVNLKDIPKSFHITSTELDHNNENVDGVSCNYAYGTDSKRFDENNGEKSEKILVDIRNILMNTSNKFGIDYETKNMLSNDTTFQSGGVNNNENILIATYLSNITEILKRFDESNVVKSEKILNEILKKNNEGNAGKSEKILQDIRNILINSSNTFGFENEIKNILSNLTKFRPGEVSNNENWYLTNITELLKHEKQTDRTALRYAEQIVKLFNQTNYLLSKIVSATLPTALHTEINTTDGNLKTNKTDEQLQKYNQNLEERLSELENQVQHILHTQNNSLKDESPNTIRPNSENNILEQQSGAQSLVFTETCVALMLFIMICCILFILYKSRLFFPARHSMSTRHIAHSVDNSNL